MKIKLTISQKQSTIHQLFPIGSNTILVEPPLRDCNQQPLLLTSPIEVEFHLPQRGFHPPKFPPEKFWGFQLCVDSGIMILVGGFFPPLKNVTSSIGMMTFPRYGKMQKMATKPPTSDVLNNREVGLKKNQQHRPT